MLLLLLLLLQAAVNIWFGGAGTDLMLSAADGGSGGGDLAPDMYLARLLVAGMARKEEARLRTMHHNAAREVNKHMYSPLAWAGCRGVGLRGTSTCLVGCSARVGSRE